MSSHALLTHIGVGAPLWSQSRPLRRAAIVHRVAHSSGFVPRRRTHGLVSEEIDGETLLYVEATHRAFCLNAAAVRVWAAIDGASDAAAITSRTGVDAALVSRTLREMGELGLLDQPAGEWPSPAVDLSRRRMVRAGLVAIPFIMAITVPRAAEAASCTTGLPGGPACSPARACCTGVCNENLGTCG